MEGLPNAEESSLLAEVGGKALSDGEGAVARESNGDVEQPETVRPLRPEHTALPGLTKGESIFVVNGSGPLKLKASGGFCEARDLVTNYICRHVGGSRVTEEATSVERANGISPAPRTSEAGRSNLVPEQIFRYGPTEGASATSIFSAQGGMGACFR